MLEVLRHLHDELGVVDERLGQVAVAEVDPALVVDLLAGDVVAADHVEQRPARPADRARDIVAGLHLGHLVADLDHLPEALVADDEMLAARRGVAVEGLVDLAVGGVDADLEHLHQHRPALGNPADVRVRLVGQLRDRECLAGERYSACQAGRQRLSSGGRLINEGSVACQPDGSEGQAGKPDLRSAGSRRSMRCLLARSSRGELVDRRLRILLAGPQDGRREVGMMDRVGKMLGLEAERLVLLVDDAPFSLERSRPGSWRCRTARPARS